MIKLIITRQDGTIYWIEHFNDIDSCNKWLADEMTRPYWDLTYTTEIIGV